jgi:Flp pilus assembly protein TadD
MSDPAAQSARQRGIQLRNVGRWDEALAAFDEALIVCPADCAALLDRSQTLNRLGRFGEALACVCKIWALGDRSPAVFLEAASTLIVLNRLGEACAVLHKALSDLPASGSAWGLLGDVLARQGNQSAAEVFYRRSAKLSPQDPIVKVKLGQWMVQTARYEEAIAFFTESRHLSPWLPDASSGLAQALISQGRLDEAEPLLREVLEHFDTHLDARLALARLLLLKGDYAAGWAAYEWRRGLMAAAMPRFPGPEWDGAPTPGKTLLVYSEQGLGDTIQFLRFIPLLSARGIKVILLVRKDLKRLCQCLTPYAKICSSDRSLPAFDSHIPLMSLPLRLGIDQDDIPGEVPYLRVTPSAKLRLRVPLGKQLKVGLVWAGQPTQGYDRLRSIGLEPLLPLAAIPDVSIYSLQIGKRAEDLRALANPPPIEDLSPILKDMADTAKIIMQLDLVVTIDTSVAHLAGALGKPVWVMLSFAPDWRWMLNSDAMPWYPTMRLFRQTAPLRWEGVVDRIAKELLALASHQSYRHHS